jgi:hypothetical protein
MEPCKNQKTQFLKNEKSGFWELQIFNSDRLLGRAGARRGLLIGVLATPT